MGERRYPVIAGLGSPLNRPSVGYGRVDKGGTVGAVMNRKWVYDFNEGSREMRDLLGGKGANLCEMTRLGLPVPPGFVISTEACIAYLEEGEGALQLVMEELEPHLRAVEGALGCRLGDPQAPLLLSVRSGARFSMPGMMDTILNLGLNPETREGLARLTGDQRFAWDSYRRFVYLFAKVAMGASTEELEATLEGARQAADVPDEAQLTPEAQAALVAQLRRIGERAAGHRFPDDPGEQLRQAVAAVFRSWNTPRAVQYREYHRISRQLGTACTVMAMVFGNAGEESFTGVCFSRNPSTGARGLFGEYLPNAQGEEVVSGRRTPRPIAELEREAPGVYGELLAVAERLERHYRDVQDIEFTVERGRLFVLQTRSAKRTAAAAIRTAVEMTAEGLLSREEALARVQPQEVALLLVPSFEEGARRQAADGGRLLGRGLSASPGAASGRAVFRATSVVEYAQRGEPVILVRPETSADDIAGILAARGVLTARGGLTSHAAVITRGLGKPAVVGWAALRMEPGADRASANGVTIAEGDWLSIDGTVGDVFVGQLPTVEPELESNRYLAELLSWADEVRSLGVRANADTPEDAARAFRAGAEGIGLCRTEHMFFKPERLPLVRELLAEDHSPQSEGYRRALAQLEEYQEEDFSELFRVAAGRPLTIRLLDAPLHEFLHEAVEANPMLGHRGARLGLTRPEVYDVQVSAILAAACRVRREGLPVQPEIMLPMISHVNELRRLKARLQRVAEEELCRAGGRVDYKFGTMIELPRAALTAAELAPEVDFFSFGSNDLTQMVFGFSRDDAEAQFLRYYLDEALLPDNPFETLDREGVGRLIRLAVGEGRAANPALKLGLCGEHGGEPRTIAFSHEIGLDYVSCSPLRVAGARLAAAQASLGPAEEDL